VVTSITSAAAANCQTQPQDVLEELASSSDPGGLVFDAASQRFRYTWKTQKTWLGCRQLTFTFQGGGSAQAMFNFTK
jgi:hypothetical protein